MMNDHKGKILVVDDDRNILQVIQMRLESGGYHVTKTTGSEKARKVNDWVSFMAMDSLVKSRPETDYLPGISGMLKILSLEYQPDAPQGHSFQGACGKIFRMP